MRHFGDPGPVVRQEMPPMTRRQYWHWRWRSAVNAVKRKTVNPVKALLRRMRVLR